jgi:hypothetical protein
MLAPVMNTLRLAAAATAATAALVVAAVGCGDNVILLPDCAIPTLDEKGADGGPDPCHCDPPPSSNIEACGCLSDPTDQDSIDDYETCTLLFHEEVEAGDDGGA